MLQQDVSCSSCAKHDTRNFPTSTQFSRQNRYTSLECFYNIMMSITNRAQFTTGVQKGIARENIVTVWLVIRRLNRILQRNWQTCCGTFPACSIAVRSHDGTMKTRCKPFNSQPWLCTFVAEGTTTTCLFCRFCGPGHPRAFRKP